jgi:O-antigen/teichoic acid export membrane protein
MAVWLALASVLQFSDRFILQMKVGAEEAAAYAASYDIVARGASGLLMPILMAAHPLIMAAHNTKSEEEARALTLRAFYWCLGAGTAVVAGSLIFSAVGGKLVPTADASLPVVVTLAMGGVAWQLALVVHKEFELRRTVAPLVLALGLSVTANVAINLLLASRMGNVGVAATNVGAVLLYMLIIRVERIRRRRVPADV